MNGAETTRSQSARQAGRRQVVVQRRLAIGQHREQVLGRDVGTGQQLFEALARARQLRPRRVEQVIAQAVDAGREHGGRVRPAVRKVVQRPRAADQQVEAGVARRRAAQIVEEFLRRGRARQESRDELAARRRASIGACRSR